MADLLRNVDLEPAHSPLRHFRVERREDGYVFIHRLNGKSYSVSADVAHSTWTNSPSSDPLTIFEVLLPPFCYGCGTELEPAEITLCQACERDQVATLTDLTARKP